MRTKNNHTNKNIKSCPLEENTLYKCDNYRLLVEHAKDLIIKISPDGILTYVNPAYCRLFGKDEENLKGKSFMAMVHEKDKEATAKAMGILGKNPHTTYVEHRALTKKGLRWIGWSGKAIMKNNEVSSVIGIGQDVTEKKKCEEESKKRSESYRKLSILNQRILDNAPVSIFLLDKNGIILSINKFGLKLTSEKNEKEILNTKIINYSNIKEIPNVEKKYLRLLKFGIPFRHENLPYTPKKNRKIYLNIVAVPIFDNAGNIDGAISIAKDNTRTYLNEKKIKKLNKELEEKVKQRTYQLENALDLKSKFIADASHELRTPLTIIQGNLDLLENEFNDNSTESMKIIKMEIRGMSKILADLSMLTNDKLNEENLHFEKIRLDSLLRIIGKSLKVLADSKEISIAFAKHFPKVEIWGDEEKIERLFLNLVRNAIKYTNEGGKVLIYIKKSADEVKIIIEDNGIGISKKDIPYIFERFYRTAQSRKTTGSGLGLAICKWVAEKHNGRIEVTSSVGKGSKFIVYLPYTPNDLTK